MFVFKYKRNRSSLMSIFATRATMSQQSLRKLDSIIGDTFQLRNDGEDSFPSLKAKVLHLATQIAALERLEPVARLIREGELLPMRKLNYNIKKLSEDDSKCDDHEDSRWTCLQKLGCQTAVFCMISFSGLAQLPAEEYDWLLKNVQRYMRGQGLPRNWVAREQIRKVMANAPRRPNAISFLNSYHKLEMQWCDTTETNTIQEKSAWEGMRNGNLQQFPPASNPHENKTEPIPTVQAEYLATEKAEVQQEMAQSGRLHIGQQRRANKKRSEYQVTDERPSKRVQLRPQQIPGQGNYCPFSFTTRDKIEKLPEPFCTGLKRSNLWKKEKETGGLEVTNCLAMYLPERKADAFFVITISYDDGFNISNFLGLGEPEILESEEYVTEEALLRD
ncbi:predicted protein [Histoplasma mississippiense (nom. inval.)]|uniref:predicted protein n=1 Tax=Ajellomyces capsulatus (strain NAm1 / WU24) TaxID=2059318 RepID=UPI000157B778|nr:predicted protein [Histoplasma mississippiense (nom. inval.)]EDN03889.1 predicted protein [Histoplasma mississippiense (nom. inval.)]